MYIQDAGVMTCFTTGAECVKYWDMGSGHARLDMGWVANLMFVVNLQ